MDAYLRGMGLSITIGAIRACNDTRRSRREEEDEYYRRFSTPWALPAWLTALPGLLYALSARIPPHRLAAHNAQTKEV